MSHVMSRSAGWVSALGLIITLSIGATACKKKKLSEEQRYAKLQKGLKYRAYKKLSKTALPPLVKVYNSEAAQGDKVPLFLCRLVLGYGWMVNSKSPFTIAEGLLITENSDTPKFGRALGHLVLSLGLHGVGLKTLAAREKDKGRDAVATKNQRKQTEQVLAVGYALLAFHALREQKLAHAIVFLRGFETVTGIGWPVAVVEVSKDLQDKKIQSGLIKAKKLSKDEQVPAPVRAKLAELVTVVEKKGGPVESDLFWPRLMSRLLLDELRKSPKLRGVFSLTDKIHKRAASLPSLNIKHKARRVLDRFKK